MSLLGQRFEGTDEDAVRVSRATSTRFRFLVTAWPAQQITEGVLVLGLGVWAAIRAGGHSALGGVGVFLVVCVLAAVIAAPGVYTLRHREEATAYFGARRAIAEKQASSHPFWATVGYVLCGALAGALAGHTHETTASREVWAVIGAVLGLVLALGRIRRGRRRANSPRTVST